MRSKKICVGEIRKACEELAEMGLIEDSGRRRNGRIVWVITPMGKLLAEEQPDDSITQGH
jgi:hypothetical protein